MTPREALASLLAVPYWVAVLVGGTVIGGSTAAATGLHGWAENAIGCAVGGTISAVAMAAQRRSLDALAGWVWARVEILAREWKELQR